MKGRGVSKEAKEMEIERERESKHSGRQMDMTHRENERLLI